MSSKKILGIGLVAAVLNLTACQTTNPYTGEQETNNATTFGLGAAVICGLIGSTKNSKHARNAALGCGAVGAGIGAYMDAQETELRKELQGSGVQVQRIGDQLKLIMPGNITFASGRSDISPSFHHTLDSVAKVLVKFKDTSLTISGHADSTGRASANQVLSANRALSVSQYLGAQGIASDRLYSRGYGSTVPVATNATAAGRQQNRRVELQIAAHQS